jgi:hypothetical protein
MDRARGIIVSALGAVVLGAGCQASPWSAGSSLPQHASVASPTPGTGPTSAAAPTGTAMPNPVTLQQVMAELQQVGALDPAGQEKLLADLQQTDPALWPLVLQQFRAAVAYRRQTEQRELAKAGQPPAGAAYPTTAADPAQPGGPAATSPYPAHIAAAAPHIGSAVPSAAPAQPGPLPGPQLGQPAAQVPPQVPPQPPQPPQTQPPFQQASKLPPPPVSAPSAFDTSPAASQADWRAQVASAAESLRARLPGSPESPEEVAEHARLRMLYLLAGQRNQALLPIPSPVPPLEQFWLKEIYGLATYLDAGRNPDPAGRAAEAKQVLGEALGCLGEAAPLVIRNLAFCAEVQSYGSMEKFSKYEFTPGQEVLLYAEVENFASEQTAEGFHTSMRSSYQIFDSRGQRVAEQGFPVTEEHCQNARRDFFIGYRLRLPKRIYDGRHTLKLTIEDLKSQKVGESSIEFWIVDAGE